MKVLSSVVESFQDFPSQDGSSIVVYFVGCEHACIGCHNPELQCAWSFPESNYSENGISTEVYYDPLRLLKVIKGWSQKYRTSKVVLSGGDPLHPFNRAGVASLLGDNAMLNYNLEFCLYTGYDAASVQRMNIKDFKYLKCGKYDETLAQTPEKTDEYFKLSSSNQELYDSNFNLLSTEGVFYFTKEQKQ